MTVLVGADDSRQPVAALGFATELSLCLLIRDWAHITDDATGQLQASHAPSAPAPAAQPGAVVDAPELHSQWRVWWTHTANLTVRQGPPDPPDNYAVRELRRFALLPEARDWATAQKRRFFSESRSRQHAVLPTGIGPPPQAPLSIYVIAADGISLISLAKHHVLITPALFADRDEYARRLRAYLSTLD